MVVEPVVRVFKVLLVHKAIKVMLALVVYLV